MIYCKKRLDTLARLALAALYANIYYMVLFFKHVGVHIFWPAADKTAGLSPWQFFYVKLGYVFGVVLCSKMIIDFSPACLIDECSWSVFCVCKKLLLCPMTIYYFEKYVGNLNSNLEASSSSRYISTWWNICSDLACHQLLRVESYIKNETFNYCTTEMSPGFFARLLHFVNWIFGPDCIAVYFSQSHQLYKRFLTWRYIQTNPVAII